MVQATSLEIAATGCATSAKRRHGIAAELLLLILTGTEQWNDNEKGNESFHLENAPNR